MMGWVDQPNLSRDMYSSLTVAALNTSRIGLMSAVTDPITTTRRSLRRRMRR